MFVVLILIISRAKRRERPPDPDYEPFGQPIFRFVLCVEFGASKSIRNVSLYYHICVLLVVELVYSCFILFFACCFVAVLAQCVQR